MGIQNPRELNAESIAATIRYARNKTAELSNALESLRDAGTPEGNYAWKVLAKELEKANRDYKEVATTVYIEKERRVFD